MWEAAKQRFAAGRVVRGTVTAHRPFGIFVDLGDPVATGLVQITEFLDSGRMTPEQYPAIGETVTAVVLGHTDEGRKQVWLCLRPSILQRQAEPGAAPDPAGR
jgi:ribosomal protein S1